MCSKHMFHRYPACCSHHMCGLHTSACMDSMCPMWLAHGMLHPDWPANPLQLTMCLVAVSWLASNSWSCICAQWLPVCCMLFAPTWNIIDYGYQCWNYFVFWLLCNFWWISSAIFWFSSSGIFWWLLAISHMSYGLLSFVPDFNTSLWQFAAFMNLPYVDTTSSSMPNLIF